MNHVGRDNQHVTEQQDRYQPPGLGQAKNKKRVTGTNIDKDQQVWQTAILIFE